MKENYYREEIDPEISIGEICLVLYETILDNDVMKKIIVGTILELHRKKYIVFYKENENIIIKIQKSNENLKESEKFIYECLKEIDKEDDNLLTLNNIINKNNKIFAKNKRKIEEFIIEEAIIDKYVDNEKINEKKRYYGAIFLSIIILYMIIRFSYNLNSQYHYLPVIAYIVSGICVIRNFIKYKITKIFTQKSEDEKKRLLNLKEYLKEYSLIRDKDLLDIHLWERYLSYSVALGINKNIVRNLEISLELNDFIESDNNDKDRKFDYYENKYFYINHKNEKIYINEEDDENVQKS